MKQIGRLSILLAVPILTSALSPFIQIKGIGPDLLMVFLVDWTLRDGRSSGIVYGFVGGLFQDLISGGVTGVSALACSAAGFVAGSFPASRGRQTLPFSLVVLTVTTLVQRLIFWMAVSRGGASGFIPLFLRYGLPSVFYTLAVGVLYSGLVAAAVRRKTE